MQCLTMISGNHFEYYNPFKNTLSLSLSICGVNLVHQFGLIENAYNIYKIHVLFKLLFEHLTYPKIKIAKLSVLAFTAPVERVFNIAGKISNPTRCSKKVKPLKL